ncbi:DUF2505 domain-containing protein [Kineococcus glutinatus]|uniref:DUF2505 domain-containing protein n=1 Tax=Kineococcus glutinatus TaxID=1070872 RepID=A0ABP9HAZ9_9ACTN
MHVREEHRFEAAVVDVVAVLTDPGFLEEKCRETRALEHSADVQQVGSNLITTVRRAQATTGLPELATRFLGQRSVLVETVTWAPAGADGRRTGRFELLVERVPLSATGTISVVPVGPAACLQVLDAEVTARVPLFGRQAEQAAADGLRKALAVENGVAARWLARRAG